MSGKNAFVCFLRLASAGLALAVVLGAPVAAYGLLEDDAQYTSSTNPNTGDNATWRYGWGNDLHPDFQIAAPGEALGFIYDIHQITPGLVGFTVPQFGTSSLSPVAKGTLIEGTYDISGLLAREPWFAIPGAIQPGEGLYGVSNRFYNQFGLEATATCDNLFFGVDRTRPNAVENLTASTAALGATQYTEASWRDIRWTPKAYDALSGVGGFKIAVNDKELAFAQNAGPDPAFEPYAALVNFTPVARPQLGNITIEDLPAGESDIDVVVVDRAGNESATSTVKAYVDADTPEVAIVSPSAGALVGVSPTFKADATDDAGVARVKFYVDNVYLGSSTTSPYSLKPSLAGLSNGTHVLRVRAEDGLANVAGTIAPHFAEAVVSFTLDKTAPRMSSLSGAPSPFFPRKRDGYKDNFTVKFASSESATALLTIRNSSGKVVRTVKKQVGAGSKSITWNGKYTDGTVHKGTFTWRLSLADAAGNKVTSSARKVSILLYQLVRVGGDKVKVVAR